MGCDDVICCHEVKLPTTIHPFSAFWAFPNCPQARGYTLDRSPAHGRANTQDLQLFTLTGDSHVELCEVTALTDAPLCSILLQNIYMLTIVTLKIHRFDEQHV